MNVMFSELTPEAPYVWYIDLDSEALVLPEIALTETELSASQRFKSQADILRFQARRRVLKKVLGDCLNKDPNTIQLVRDIYGKPHLVKQPKNFFFNTSHSKSLMTIAVGNSPIGIDIAQISEDVDFQTIALHFYSPQEQAYLAAHSDPRSMFFRMWAAKEAYLKALGIGIRNLRNIELFPDKNDFIFKDTWRIKFLDSPAGWVTSVAWKNVCNTKFTTLSEPVEYASL